MVDCPELGTILEIQLIDLTTGEDMFIDGKLDSDSILIIDSKNNDVYFEFMNHTESEFSIISIYESYEGSSTYFLSVGASLDITIETVVKINYKKCCDFYQTDSVNFSDYKFERANNKVRYKVFID